MLSKDSLTQARWVLFISSLLVMAVCGYFGIVTIAFCDNNILIAISGVFAVLIATVASIFFIQISGVIIDEFTNNHSKSLEAVSQVFGCDD